MGFNYYSFILDGKERIYYTCVSNDNELEILEWAERYGFIQPGDFQKCTNIRKIHQSEVDKRNQELYKVWWEQHKNDDFLFSEGLPPTIGEVELD